MSSYQWFMQFLAKNRLRTPIISGDGDSFARAYRNGDIGEQDLFHVKEESYYSHREEDELLLLLMDGKRQGDQGKHTLYAKTFFVPTPLFIRKDRGCGEPIVFNPCHIIWKKTGEIPHKERVEAIEEFNYILEN